jgi:hypothetical protein
MSENMSFGDWRDVNPETMKTYSEAKLLLAMKSNQGGVYDTWARAELARRRDEQLGDLLNQLTAATQHVHEEVAKLGSSSGKLETLTTTLRNLTWVLIFLTFVAAAVPIGIEVWKAFHEPQTAPVSEQLW